MPASSYRRKAQLTAAALTALALIGTTSTVSFAAPALANDANSLAGKAIFIDPGHSGANDASINRLVTTGRGGTKPCQTTGTSAANGYAEHTFNWQLAQRVDAILEGMGAKVYFSRANDTTVGPCVDQRAQMANGTDAAAVVSLHADGSAAGNHGFHVNLSAPPLNSVQSTQAPVLANDIRDALVAAGLTPANYIGTNGIYQRADLTGLNLATKPSVLVEAGNMANPDDLAILQSPAGQQKLAQAIVNGLVKFLTPAGR